MTGDADLAGIGGLLADRTRATILLSLLNGGLTPASVLAERARVSRPLASAHLRKLSEGGLIVAEPRGRQRFYRLASQTIADALEVLMLLAPPTGVTSLRGARESEGLRQARLCYDHLAGRVGVALTGRLLDRGDLVEATDGYRLTARGEDTLHGLAIDVGALHDHARPLTRACMDWSERRHHLAGGIGAALTTELLRRDWVRTREASRAVAVTAAGHEGLLEHFGLAAGDLEPRSEAVLA